MQCLVYIDLNMVRAGVVEHPKDWVHGGYFEVQNTPKRYRLINIKRLCQLFSLTSEESLQKARAMWIEDSLCKGMTIREEKWTKSLAVGGFAFTEGFVDSLGLKGQNRKFKLIGDTCVVNEPAATYNAFFDGKKASLSD